MYKQRKPRMVLFLGLISIVLLACGALGEVPFLATPTPTATSTPLPPTATPTNVPQPPEITRLELKEYIEDGVQYFDIMISYRDPDGDARDVHYEILESTVEGLVVEDGTLSDTSSKQEAGGVAVGNWNCGGETYTFTLEVTIIDRKGGTSNAESIAISCDALSAIPTYSQVIASYPAGTELCGTDVDIVGMEGDKYQLEIRTLSINANGLTIKCFGTKVTLKVDAMLDGKSFSAGAQLTLDKNGNWIEVSSWE